MLELRVGLYCKKGEEKRSDSGTYMITSDLNKLLKMPGWGGDFKDMEKLLELPYLSEVLKRQVWMCHRLYLLLKTA